MSDITCIYEMNMIRESSQVEADILSGRAMDVLLLIMEGEKNCREISVRLDMPVFSVKVYTQRLVDAGLIVEEKKRVQNDYIESYFRMVSDEVEILNSINKDELSSAERKQLLCLSAQHYAMMTKDAIISADENNDRPNKIKAYFMKTSRDSMERFKDEIDRLFHKYQSLEELDADETYSLFTVLAPQVKEA